METFKAILKLGLSRGATKIVFKAGQFPMLMAEQGTASVQDRGQSTAQALQLLMQTLIPAGVSKFQTGQPAFGSMTVVNHGHLKLIGIPGPQASLTVYIPPSGEALFQNDWQSLSNVGVKAPAPQQPMSSPLQQPLTPEIPLSTIANQDRENAVERFAPPHSQVKSAPEESLAGIPLSQFEMPQETSTNQVPTPAPAPLRPAQENIPAEPQNPFSLNVSDPMPPPTPVHADPIPAPSPVVAPMYVSTPMAAPTPPPTSASMGGGFMPQIPIPAFDELALLEPLESTKTQIKATPEIPTHAVDQNFPADLNFDLPPMPMAPEMELQKPQAIKAAPIRSAPKPGEDFDHHESEFVTPPSTPKAPTIYFGAHIPGQTIENKGGNLIDGLLREMIQQKASDLHLTLGEPPSLRKDGEIQRIQSAEPVKESYMAKLFLPIMPPANQKEFAEKNDTDFAYELPGVARFRVNMFRDMNGVGGVLRQIPSEVLTADQLGLAPAIRKLCNLNKGLVLVTGPTGSGKSTTLAGMIDLINASRHDHIITIEDPIEFVHKQKNCLINQREVHRHTQSFSRALRAALREDPDIVLIGEMRDLETVSIAIETAETGHLVFGTLHTNTAISTIDRIIDQFPTNQQAQVRIMLAESLKGVISQTLVKKIGGGRAAAQEILIVNKAVGALVREAKTHMVANHMQTQKTDGNILLNEALINLVTKKIVDPKEAYMKAVDKDAFLALLQQKGIPTSFLTGQAA